jgi:hypothetical protein
MKPRTVWAAGVGTFIVVNGVAWRKGDKATLCAAFIRPIIEALGPIGEPAMWGGFLILGRHIVKHIPR